jgi:hypothetical protein
MTLKREFTPEWAWEWLLESLHPKKAAAVVESDIARLEKQIRFAQIELTVSRSVLKKINQDEWPKDENGCLTYSPNHPLAD